MTRLARGSPPLRFALLAAVILAIGAGLAPPLVSPVEAARPDLSLVTDAQYDVQPELKRIAVTVDVTATNHRTDTATRRYYYDAAFLTVQPDTINFSVSAASGKPTVRISKRTKDYTLLEVRFGTRVFSGRNLEFQVKFDLPDPGGSPTRDVRIGTTLVAFPVWAYSSEDTPGSAVSVTIPTGYEVKFEAGEMAGPTTTASGDLLFTAGSIVDALDYYAYIVADRPGAFEEQDVSTSVNGKPVEMVVRAWTDDPEWGTRTADLFRDGMPVLGEAIGLDYPAGTPVVVKEAVSRSLGGYAGLFDPEARQIEVAYYADAAVVLHEAAHTWFNGALLADRWANEAFASYYADVAVRELAIDAPPDRLTDELRKARIPLNAWGAVGRESGDVEDYAYAATFELAEQIAARAGTDALRDVWDAASVNETAYQPVTEGSEPERGAGAPDWRGLLDLLEEHSDDEYVDLWRTWVVRPEDAGLLDQRASARAEYEETLEAAADWELPASIRGAMSAWQFDSAQGLMSQAQLVAQRRGDVEAAAAAAGLTPPDTLEEAFEGTGGLREATLEADAELAAIASIQAAAGSEPRDPDPLTQLGLYDVRPADDIAAARSLFASGNIDEAVDRAEGARAVWTAAPELGASRARTMAAGVIALLVLLFVAWRTARNLRRRRRRPAFATPVAGWTGMATPILDNPDDPDATSAYATLPDNSPTALIVRERKGDDGG